MSQITSEKKDEIFRHPRVGSIHFGRCLGVAAEGESTWATLQMGESRHTRALVVASRPDQTPRVIRGSNGQAHQPCLAVSDRGEVAVVWNEATADGWEIHGATVDGDVLGAHHVIHRSPELCLPPTAVFHDNRLCVAWSGRLANRMRIHATTQEAGGFPTAQVVSAPDVDAFRPHLACGAGRAILVWDEYRDQRYQVSIAQQQDGSWVHTATLGQSAERWLQSRAVVGPDGRAFVVWVVLKPVTDKLGIIDHWPLGMVARIENDRVIPIRDPSHPSDPRTVADLRDGLLASKIYKGYVGLRRNPFLSVNDRGDLWCIWESRGESEGSTVAGALLARRLNTDGTWCSPLRVAETGYCYAAPPRFRGNHLPFACLRFDQRGTDVVHLACADLGSGRPIVVDESRWDRWHVQPIEPQPKPAQSIDVDGIAMRYFWADTHVHSVFSPDAEGELDELAHFARDRAGLDILTVIDNDYYPHKALTEPEWRIHQELADHFSEEGRFLWLPGYEFTYHRGDLVPDFNHRCVSFPLGCGPLHRRIDPQTNTDHKMIPVLKAAGAMVYPHHCTYELIDNDAEWNVEATSSWRVCVEETDFTIRQLRAGKRLGFIGSSDTHRAIPGLGGARTGVLAEALTREAVLKAYRNRRLIATQGHNIWIDFRIQGSVTGSQTVAGTAPRIFARIESPAPLDYVELVRDGRVVHRILAGDSACTFSWTDERASEGSHFYFLRVKLVGDPSFNRDGYDPTTNDPRPFSQDSRYPHNLARARGPFAWASPIWMSVRSVENAPS